MNKIITLISFCFIFIFNGTYAQKLDYETTSPWFWGLNAGAAWNTTDVRNQTNWGWGATLGRSFNFDYGNVFSFDIRGRYLGGNWRGQDFDTTNFNIPNKTLSSGITNYDSLVGYSVNNFNSKVHELDLELVIHFNRFIEKTGVDPYIFGGVGISWYNTKGNLINSSTEDLYDYNSLDSYSKGSINSLLDDSYETSLDGTSGSTFNAKFMPSLGVGLGYYFGKRFSMGIEHKTTFTLLDDFDGYNNPTSKYKDWYHYTNIYFKYYFKNRQHSGSSSNNNNNNTTTNPIIGGGTGDCQKPIIRINQPSNNQTVKYPNLTLSADVAHTNSSNDIQVTVNGTPTTNFTYSNQTNKLTLNSYLVEGQNSVSITSTNSCGSTTETVFVNFVPDCIPPTTRFTNPVNSGTLVNSGTYYVTADIFNLTKNQGITFNVNGVSVSSYSFNAQTGKFSATVNLRQGQNNLELFATNNCGSTSTATNIGYSFNCPTPVIAAINTTNGTTVQSELFTFEASFQNVKAANQVSLTLNGVTQNQGQFQSTKGWYQNVLRLNKGQNIIVISTTNECGTASQTVVVNYEAPCTTPVVSFKNPTTPGSSVTTPSYFVSASIYGMTGSQNITYKVNGVQITNYSFNAQNGVFSSTINLQEGSNTIELIASNSCGTVSQITVVNYNYNCPKPTVQFIYPEQNLTVSNANYTIQALVSNITSSNQVQLFVNGQLKTGGTYNSSNSLYSITVSLAEGFNNIELKATNSCGTISNNASVSYTRIVEPLPVISMTGTCDATVEAGQHYISGFITSVANSNQVSISVNGTSQSNVSFANTSQGLNFGFYLNATSTVETYVIIVTAQNSSGSISKTCVVRVNKPDENITICVLEGRIKVTKTIKLSQWPQYQAQGATLGNCPEIVDENIVICVKVNNKNVTKTIKQSQWPQYQAQGATLGECPEIVDEDIIICILEGRIPVTKTIKQSQWPYYHSIGATLGKCPEPVDEDIVVCVKLGNKFVTRTIKQSQWPQYQAQGATLGKCPEVEEKITICHIPPGNPNNPQTIEIPLSAWPAHQAHGDKLGACPEPVDEDMVICVLQGKVRVTKTIKQSQWPQYQAQGATLGKCPEPVDEDIVVCVKLGNKFVTRTIKQSQWPQYQAQGATLGKCPEVEEKITICHIPPGNPNNPQTIEIPLSAWPAHQAHGDKLGACPEPVDEDIVICVLQGKVRVTKTIKQSQWPQYQAQGATLGRCPEPVDEDILICVLEGRIRVTKTIKQSQWSQYQAQGATLGKCPEPVDEDIVVCVKLGNKFVTRTIKQSQWPQYQAQGATLGKCPEAEEKITICHIPPGNPNNPQTIEIPLSAWPAHQAHGDKLGACPEPVDEDIVICVLQGKVRVTKTIKQSQWPQYQAQGATLGKCPEPVDEDILICVLEGRVRVTKTIKQSQWSQYQAQGATLGKCPEPVDEDIVICVLEGRKPVTRTIKQSQWAQYQALGATLGACPSGSQTGADTTATENPNSVGGTVGNKIKICIEEKGVMTTKIINASEWPSYAALGATKGECTSTAVPKGTTGRGTGSSGRTGTITRGRP